MAETMGRASWCGTLRLRKVAIGVKAYPATSGGERSSFHQIHSGCGKRIEQKRCCPEHGELESAAIAKAYPVSADQLVEIDQEELESLRPANERALVLEEFVSGLAIDPAMYDGRGMYLEPDGLLSERAYEVLVRGMADAGKSAIGRIVLANSRRLALVRVHGSVLAMDILKYPEQLKTAPQRAAKEVDPKELRLLGQVLKLEAGPIDWSRYRDDSAEELAELVRLKLEGKRRQTADVQSETVLSFVDALKASLAEGKRSRRAG